MPLPVAAVVGFLTDICMCSRNLYTPGGKIVNLGNWLAVCTERGIKQPVGMKIQMNRLVAMDESKKQFTLDVRIEFAWYDSALRTLPEMKKMGIDYEKMMWAPFDSFRVSNEIEYSDYPTGSSGVEKSPNVDEISGLAVATRNRRYIISNKAWDIRHYPFDARTLEVEWYLGHRMYIQHYPVSAFHRGALKNNGWLAPNAHPHLVADTSRRLLSKVGPPEAGPLSEAERVAAETEAKKQEREAKEKECETEDDAYELSLKSELRFTDTVVVRNSTHITTQMFKKFSTPWAGFILGTSETNFYTGSDYPFPACMLETCATTTVHMGRMSTPILTSAVALLVLCVCMVPRLAAANPTTHWVGCCRPTRRGLSTLRRSCLA